MKRKSGFTLVEMLVVVVIIGILSAALIPRLTGYMARTRDLKRQTDLRNIAAAITMYKNDHGEFPKIRGVKDFAPCSYCFGGINSIQNSLSPYLSSIPRDPQKTTSLGKVIIEDHQHFVKKSLKKGEYLYRVGAYSYKPKDGLYPDFALLVAKMETPDMANYIIQQSGWYGYNLAGYSFPGCISYKEYGFDSLAIISNKDRFLTCDEIIKGETASITKDEYGKIICKYSNVDQLYYLIKVER